MKSFPTALALMGTAVLATSVTAFTPDPAAYYKLVTKFREPFNECLEGNRLSPHSTLGGAAFMAKCTTVFTGQMWKFIPAGNGFYRMTTLFLENENKCFEGNKLDESSTLGGAAFMDTCQNVSGQLWKINQRDGYFTLTTQFRDPHGECLEGNKFAPTSTLQGAAFMSHCDPFTGQLWKAIRI